MILSSVWYEGRGRETTVPGNGLSFFPLGQIKVFDMRPTDNQSLRATTMWNPYPDWLPGAASVTAPYIGNKLTPIEAGWLPKPTDVGGALG